MHAYKRTRLFPNYHRSWLYHLLTDGYSLPVYSHYDERLHVRPTIHGMVQRSTSPCTKRILQINTQTSMILLVLDNALTTLNLSKLGVKQATKLLHLCVTVLESVMEWYKDCEFHRPKRKLKYTQWAPNTAKDKYSNYTTYASS